MSLSVTNFCPKSYFPQFLWHQVQLHTSAAQISADSHFSMKSQLFTDPPTINNLIVNHILPMICLPIYRWPIIHTQRGTESQVWVKWSVRLQRSKEITICSLQQHLWCVHKGRSNQKYGLSQNLTHIFRFAKTEKISTRSVQNQNVRRCWRKWRRWRRRWISSRQQIWPSWRIWWWCCTLVMQARTMTKKRTKLQKIFAGDILAELAPIKACMLDPMVRINACKKN